MACPVYKVLKEEQASPRARLQLIKAFENKTLQSSPLLKELISKCLMCGSCALACPSGINHYEKFMDMRQKMVKDLGETPAIKSLIYLLSKESRIRRGAGMAKLGQKLTPAWLANKHCMGNIPLNQLPGISRIPLRKKMTTAIPARGAKKGSLVYFTGCATNYIYKDTGLSMISVLTRLGYDLIIPQDQTCCAIPLLFHGARDQALENMVTNITALGAHECDGILVDCTTCGAALKDEYPALIRKLMAEGSTKGTPQASWETLAVQAKKIADKTTDILSFISAHKQDLVFDKATPNLGKVAYHAPCHSRNSFNTWPLVQALLKELPFIDYTPTPEEAECCGGGGTFFYEHPKTAKKIMDKKILHIKEMKPRYLLTDCPVCRINLTGNLDTGKTDQPGKIKTGKIKTGKIKTGKTYEYKDIQVLHPITLIYNALKKDAWKKDAWKNDH